ncbi:MAG: FAD-dependent monooxygenase, partial [Paracoccaceae bacterium]|nr:FAD-dependent monooxygenase [Paracoccaceae bacterium]
FNKGQSALLHKQPDGVWRIDLQLGWDIDKAEEKKPENVIPRLKAMLGDDVEFSLEWVSIYTFQCRRMERFRHNRVIFAGDSAHQVSPFGARGANSGLQDTDNLIWKLKLVLEGRAPDALLDSYDAERIHGADENILNSSRSTDFITPKSEISRVFRDAVLDLSEHHAFARPLVNSGRLSMPCTYDGSPLNSADALASGPARTRPGSPCPDVALGNAFLLDSLGGCFTLLTVNADAPDSLTEGGIAVTRLALSTLDDTTGALAARYLGDATSAVYLIRPDQHVAARFATFDEAAIRAAIRRATGQEMQA